MNRLRSAPVVALLLLVGLARPVAARCGHSCARTPEGCGKGFGTLAYVVTTCRVVGNRQIGAQELRIQRAGCDPVTVLRMANPEPVADPFQLCALAGHNHLGTESPIAGIFQRLGVTPDGKGVVFELSNAFQLVGRTPLAPDEQGFFYVRADGSGLRRLGPPSRDPTYRVFFSGGKPAAGTNTRVAFNRDARLVVFTDRGPGPDGVETEQLVTIDLATGERRQVTHLPAAEPFRPGEWPISYFFVFGREGHEMIKFIHQTKESEEGFDVGIDGTGLRSDTQSPGASLGGGGHVIERFRRSGLSFGIGGLVYPEPPANAAELPDFPFAFDLVASFGDRRLIQLTNFHYGDTALLGVRPNDVVFLASADPVGANPFHNCELFRISPLGLGLRQLTHFDHGRRSEEGCQVGALPGCGIREVNEFPQDASPALTFYSDCDPLGTNPNGSQVFAIRWHGAQLRQLTHTRGATTAPDGSVVEVEIPGPVARGGPR